MACIWNLPEGKPNIDLWEEIPFINLVNSFYVVFVVLEKMTLTNIDS